MARDDRETEGTPPESPTEEDPGGGWKREVTILSEVPPYPLSLLTLKRLKKIVLGGGFTESSFPATVGHIQKSIEKRGWCDRCDCPRGDCFWDHS